MGNEQGILLIHTHAHSSKHALMELSLLQCRCMIRLPSDGVKTAAGEGKRREQQHLCWQLDAAF